MVSWSRFRSAAHLVIISTTSASLGIDVLELAASPVPRQAGSAGPIMREILSSIRLLMWDQTSASTMW